MSSLSLEYFENGVKAYQDQNLYKFTSDAIKLAKFCKLKGGDHVLDMCAGCGVVGLYAYSISPCRKMYFNDIQVEMCDLIEKNIDVNGLNEKCQILCKDLSELNANDFEKPLDVILCNPPYFKRNGKIKEEPGIAMCRHEIATSLDKIVCKAGQIIKFGGRLYMIIPAARLCELVVLMNKNGFEVKNIEVFHSGSASTVVAVEGVKGGKSGVNIKVVKEGV